jgi:hypothetical protein
VSGLELLKLFVFPPLLLLPFFHATHSVFDNSDKVMHINSDALTSLQIFSDESHASIHSSATKEGLSLFGSSPFLPLHPPLLTHPYPQAS